MSTAFQLRQNDINLVCKNQDVIYDGVYLFTNQRGIRKTALIMPPAQPACWVSIYGSLTVSQIGKENPNGGINEKGLVVEQTTLWQTQYPTTDERPALGELQWIQYLLDTCSTVQEVLEAAATIRIDQSTSKLHYLVADRSGDRAIVEFIEGVMTVHRDLKSLPIITNTAYVDAVEAINNNDRNWSQWGEYERNSMDRFLVVAESTQTQLEPNSYIDSALKILFAARREDTVYSLVYYIDIMEIHVITARNQERVTVVMTDFNFDKEAPAKAVNLQRLHADDVRAQFENYSAAFNHHAVASFFRDPILTSVFKWEITDEMIYFVAHYPDSFV